MTLLPLDYAARNLGRSRSRLAFCVAGATLVVLLILCAAAFVRGMQTSLRGEGSGSNVILLGAGSEDSIERSEIPPAAAGLVAASLKGLRSRLGVAYVSPEAHVALPLSDSADHSTATQTLVRGVSAAAFLVYAHVQITEGRAPRSGENELLVGSLAATRMGVRESSLAVGSRLYVDTKPWTIVGRFAAPGSVMESEVWTDLADLKTATRRTTDSVVVITLDTAEFADVSAFCKQRLDLELSPLRESDYYAKLGAFFRPVQFVAWATAGLIALGGLFGGLNTMYAAFASRVRELGMLQCLGFRRSAIVISLATESLLAAAAGTLIACAIGLLALDGLAVRFSMGAFGLRVDAPVLVLAMLAGLALGVVGALPPAWRCLRMPIPESLKSI